MKTIDSDESFEAKGGKNSLIDRWLVQAAIIAIYFKYLVCLADSAN
jgi:hypothetical protein